MGNSALIGSFERKTNSPIEAQYIFPTYEALIAFYDNPDNEEWKENLHKGLLKIVEDDGNGNLVLYWVTPNGPELDFKALITSSDIEKINAVLKAIAGTTSDDVIAYLATLPEDFNNITKLVTQLDFFLTKKEPETDTINTWLELADFLDGYKDTDVLYNIIEEIRLILSQALTGVGLNTDGTYAPDEDTTYLGTATSVMDALAILDAVVKRLDKTYEPVNEDIVPLEIITTDEKVVFKARLNVSQIDGNGLIKQDDGLFIKVEQDYVAGVLNLKINGTVVSQIPLGLSVIGIEDAKYDPITEDLVVTFKLVDGTSQVLRISLATLIREWVIDNSDPTKVVVLTKEEVHAGDPDKLSADVRLSNSQYNILEKDGNTLLVRGVTDNIKHTDNLVLDVVIETIKTNIEDLQARVPDLDVLMTEGAVRGAVTGYSNLSVFNPPGLKDNDYCIVFSDETHDSSDSLYRWANNIWNFVKSWTGGGGSSTVVINSLDSTSTTAALSANQGRVLKGLIDDGIGNTYTKTEIDEMLQDYARLTAELVWTAYQNFQAGAGSTSSSFRKNYKNKKQV